MREDNSSKWKWILFELVSTFLGVTAAFLLNDFREAKYEEKMKKQYFQTFLFELEVMNASSKQLLTTTDSLISALEDKMQKKEKFDIIYLSSLSFAQRAKIVEMAFSTGYFENLPPHYIGSISQGLNLIRRIEHSTIRYQEACRSISAVTNKEDYFDEEGFLKPKFRWYINDLKEIKKLSTTLISEIEKGAIPATKNLLK